MSPQTETKASVGFKAGVKDYRLTYYTPEYETLDTDILAAFRVTPQPGVPPEEAGAAVAAESSTGTWTSVWTDGLTSLDRYKGRCYNIEPVAGEENQYICYVAYPLDLRYNFFHSLIQNERGALWKKQYVIELLIRRRPLTPNAIASGYTGGASKFAKGMQEETELAKATLNKAANKEVPGQRSVIVRVDGDPDPKEVVTKVSTVAGLCYYIPRCDEKQWQLKVKAMGFHCLFTCVITIASPCQCRSVGTLAF
ncbi:uncharacterized protein LOC130827083 [Amaranthus tricolor]|uniref:uncharacterized protein LOC130827083 n=1 Tax=Amaranthus tricolor TaxID=29722 RepID=UPI0025867D92|nr:uncharacterized protein LOC130827083 [Amaranthus tricolor]